MRGLNLHCDIVLAGGGAAANDLELQVEALAHLDILHVETLLGARPHLHRHLAVAGPGQAALEEGQEREQSERSHC